MDYVNYGLGAVHEIGHNLGLTHEEMNSEAYYGRVYKTFRFALAAVGDESEACPSEEAPWQFRSQCFKSFGNYKGDELASEERTSEKLDAPPQRVAVSSHSRRLEPAAIFPPKMLNSPMRRVWWEGLSSPV